MEIKEFENCLLKLDDRCATNLGFHDGKTGLSLLYFLLNKLSGESRFKDKAEILLDELAENMHLVQNLGFADGIAGVGWAVEWLAQNKFIEINTDEILEDLDTELYKAVVFSQSLNLSLEEGTIGRILYFYSRLCAKNSNQSRYRILCNQECLVLLIDDIGDKLLNDDDEIDFLTEAYSTNSLILISQILILSAKVYQLKINVEKSKLIFDAITKFSEKFLDQKRHYDQETVDPYLHLLYAFGRAGELTNNDKQILNTSHYLKKLNLELKADTIDLSPVQKFLFNRLIYITKLDFEKFQISFDEQSPSLFLALIYLNENFVLENENWYEGWAL